MKIIDKLISLIREFATCNENLQVEPSCILWTDQKKQFEKIIPKLQDKMPELLVLGDYDPNNRKGPAIWIRCAIDGKITNYSPSPYIPVIYLPSVSRSEMRAVEDYPEKRKPIAFLQYRGILCSQTNGEDLTILSFLKSSLKLDVADKREATLSAMQTALSQLIEEDFSTIQKKHLDEDYFNKLINGEDQAKTILQWFDEGDTWRTNRTKEQWDAFVNLCKKNYSFDPELDGREQGLALFAKRQGNWKSVFERYEESFDLYKNIYDELLNLPNRDYNLFHDAEQNGGWPQWNNEKEEDLRSQLASLSTNAIEVAAEKLHDLAEDHIQRLKLVWAKQGKSPLAEAVDHLDKLAKASLKGCSAQNLDEIRDYYINEGYKIDDEALSAISCQKNETNRNLIKDIVLLFYKQWLEKVNNKFHDFLKVDAYPAERNIYQDEDSDTCCLFVDGLRLDLAKKISTIFKNENFNVQESFRWAPLPTITATGKPAAVPSRELLRVEGKSTSFDPLEVMGLTFNKYIENQGWTKNTKDKTLWEEFGNIDSLGHSFKSDLPLYLIPEIDQLIDKIRYLLEKHSKIRIVTDHGWLWLPSSFPKEDLSGHIDEKKVRYTLLEEGEGSNQLQLPWFWNRDVFVTYPQGICSFRAGMEYVHGGVSLQECLLLELFISCPLTDKLMTSIKEIKWVGSRCRYKIDGDFQGCHIDIRLRPTDFKTSILKRIGEIKEDGTGSVIVEDDSLDGQAAIFVIIDENGNILKQLPTQIGN